MRIAIQMDEIASLNPQSDTSLLLAQEAQARGHALWYYLPRDLSYHHPHITAHAWPLALQDNPERPYRLGESVTLDLATMDVVLIRQDPPFDMAYITTTYLLEKLPARTRVINNPAELRNLPEKLFPFVFDEFAPPTLISADIKEIHRFCQTHQDIVIKPLYGHAGNAVFRSNNRDENFNALLEHFFLHSPLPIILQPFLPEIRTHETRITFIDGQVVGAMRRVPPAGEIRVNLRLGGTTQKTELTARQIQLCERLGPELKKRGLLLAGVDMIGDHLIEVNITSPTGLIAMNNLYDTQLEKMFWDAVEKRDRS